MQFQPVKKKDHNRSIRSKMFRQMTLFWIQSYLKKNPHLRTSLSAMSSISFLATAKSYIKRQSISQNILEKATIGQWYHKNSVERQTFSISLSLISYPSLISLNSSLCSSVSWKNSEITNNVPKRLQTEYIYLFGIITLLTFTTHYTPV